MAQKFERGEDQIKSNDRARVVGGSLELNASNAIRIWILMKVEIDLISRLWEQKQKMAIQILARKLFIKDFKLKGCTSLTNKRSGNLCLTHFLYFSLAVRSTSNGGSCEDV